MSSQKEKLSPFLNKIIQGNCIKNMQTLPEKSIDMIFADPPYNLQLGGDLHRPDESKVDAVDDAWDRFDSMAAYDDFTEKWLSAAQNLLTDDGTLWVIGSYHNIFRVGKILQDLGFWILNDVIWRKSNPMPNFRGRRFTNAHETMIWASKSEKSKYTFNYESMKQMNEDLQMRSDWFLPICNGGERLKDDNGNKVHATQKPESLLQRVIMASSNVGDTVLDPFLGTGTTGAVAKRLNRNFIGLERETKYIKAATARIDAIEPLPHNVAIEMPSKRSEPRVPFGWLLERGMIEPGSILTDAKKKIRARVNADGSLNFKSTRGSIHKVGAHIEGRQSCNGWTYWHIEEQNKTIPIDALRTRLRQEMFSDT